MSEGLSKGQTGRAQYLVQERVMPKILVVDDHATQRLFLEQTLRRSGHEPWVAEDGKAALAIMGTCMPDICFIDWMLPGMTGLEVVQAIRSQPGGDRCYIIMVTSRTSPEDLSRAFEVGVDDFMGKPVGGMELRSRLKAAVRLSSLHKSLAERVREVSTLNEQLSKVNGKLEALVSEDVLTGLANRRAGLRRLDEAWEASSRYRSPLSVAMVDIDYFKGVNDRFGHACGDAVIRHVASILQTEARECDTVARVGGEEFVVILQRTEAASAMVCLERARERVMASPCRVESREISVSFSVGLAERRSSVGDPETLLRIADRALYVAKGGGRNRVMLAADASYLEMPAAA